MFKSIYIRLAFTNLKKNKRSYLPFLVTSIITIMLFFDMSITIPELKKCRGQAA